PLPRQPGLAVVSNTGRRQGELPADHGLRWLAFRRGPRMKWRRRINRRSFFSVPRRVTERQPAHFCGDGEVTACISSLCHAAIKGLRRPPKLPPRDPVLLLLATRARAFRQAR